MSNGVKQTLELTENESNSLVWIRTLAMLSIVVTHLFQAYRNIWADVFNTGVQVFLVMSGYLYGYKNITDWRGWVRKRFKKIYLPYLVFLIAVIPLYALFHEEAMKWKVLPLYFCNLQGFRFLRGGTFARIEGIRHVWFITAIMVAYLSTPFLQRLKKNSKVALPALLMLIAVAYMIAPSLRYVFVLSWVYLYAIGYLFVNLDKKWRLFYIGLFSIALLYLCVIIQWDDFRHAYQPIYRCFHDLVGICVVLVGVWLLSSIKNLRVPKVVSFLDKYSFHIFMVHFIIICGPFSMAHVTPYIGLNVVIMLLATAIATFFFVKLMDLIYNILERKR
jgi:peptidoglycan/LPS O-acetylase OafA/YrhL